MPAPAEGAYEHPEIGGARVIGKPAIRCDARRNIAHDDDKVTVMFNRLRRRIPPPAPTSVSASVPGTGLQVCARCRADYVHPLEWHETDAEHWWILLRCGECHAEREVTIGDDVVKRYGEDLDAAQREIDRVASRLGRERMAREIEIFVAALELDLIDANDFARRNRY
jgi:hypothetical protein